MTTEDGEPIAQRVPLETRFEEIFYRLLKREEIDFYGESVGLMFMVIVTNLMAEVSGRQYHWYDGVAPWATRIRKPQQIEFTGEMAVADDHNMWKEDFRATVTDKRVTKQGIWIVLQIGDDRAEGELATAFGRKPE